MARNELTLTDLARVGFADFGEARGRLAEIQHSFDSAVGDAVAASGNPVPAAAGVATTTRESI